MKFVYWAILFSLFLPLSSWADENLTAEEILRRVDQNVYSNTKVSKSRMIVYNQRGTPREMALDLWIVGTEKSFANYTAPKKEAGTKMLKLKDNLWTYSPSSDRTIQIAGHLLRQSIMGSDFSYEDVMDDVKLSGRYKPTLIGDDTYMDRPVWVLDLNSTDPSTAYVKRKLWVDKEQFLGAREERYAKSGKLLKSMALKEVKKFGDRWYPNRMLLKDELKGGNGTEFITDDIKFDMPIEEHIFSKQSLRK